MKNIFAIILFAFFSICINCYIGYIDEGNAANYNGLFHYLITDAVEDNFINDNGRHVITIIFTIVFYSFYILIDKLNIVEDFYVVQLLLSIFLLPLSVFIIVLFAKLIAKAYRFIF